MITGRSVLGTNKEVVIRHLELLALSPHSLGEVQYLCCFINYFNWVKVRIFLRFGESKKSISTQIVQFSQ